MIYGLGSRPHPILVFLTGLERAAGKGRPLSFGLFDRPMESRITMKQRNRIGLWPAIGIMIDQKQIAMCVTVATRRGRRKLIQEIRECETSVPRKTSWAGCSAGSFPRGLARRRKLGPWVRMGLAESRVFQAAVPITPSNRQHTPQNFFLEAVQVTNVRAEDRIVELIKVELEGQRLACVAASPRGVVESSIDMMSKLGTRVGLIELGPASLFRAGAYSPEATARLEVVLRILPGEQPGNRAPGRGPTRAFLAYVRAPQR